MHREGGSLLKSYTVHLRDAISEQFFSGQIGILCDGLVCSKYEAKPRATS
jgi:hypothetical protein